VRLATASNCPNFGEQWRAGGGGAGRERGCGDGDSQVHSKDTTDRELCTIQRELRAHGGRISALYWQIVRCFLLP